MTLALVVAIPFATAVLIALLGGRLGRRVLGIATTLAMASSFGAAASMIVTLRSRPTIEAVVGPWLPIAGADLALTVDSSMLAVTLAVTGISALIALYSIAYLADDRGLQRYFAAFALLVAGLLVIVLGANLLLVFAGWELAGVAAYLLVGHHRDDPRAQRSAMLGFIVERGGDAALVSGFLLFFADFHTVEIAQLAGVAVEHGSSGGLSLAAVAGGLVLVGALAKSAQLPLQIWLPEAAEAITPVSALLQSTVVVGGVVLLMRLRSVIVPDVLQIAAVIGGVTALVGAVAAIAQRDVRRILAWSTISQVGLMFVGAGLGSLFAARFHLIAHALLKSVLVLGVGAVRRAVANESDVARLGGLARGMRWTAAAFAIGTLGLAAIPPVAGFFGVAAVVSAAFSDANLPLVALVLLSVAASAFAGVRAFVLVFVAPPAAVRTVRESPLLDLPLALLALGALLFGAAVSGGVLPIGSGPADEAPAWLVVATFAVSLTAAAAAWLAYRHGPARAAGIERATRSLHVLVSRDAVYATLLSRAADGLARELEAGAERVVGAGGGGVGAALARAGALMGRGQPEAPRLREALVLAATAVLVAYWTWSAR